MLPKCPFAPIRSDLPFYFSLLRFPFFSLYSQHVSRSSISSHLTKFWLDRIGGVFRLWSWIGGRLWWWVVSVFAGSVWWWLSVLAGSVWWWDLVLARSFWWLGFIGSQVLVVAGFPIFFHRLQHHSTILTSHHPISLPITSQWLSLSLKSHNKPHVRLIWELFPVSKEGEYFSKSLPFFSF